MQQTSIIIFRVKKDIMSYAFYVSFAGETFNFLKQSSVNWKVYITKNLFHFVKWPLNTNIRHYMKASKQKQLRHESSLDYQSRLNIVSWDGDMLLPLGLEEESISLSWFLTQQVMLVAWWVIIVTYYGK